MAIDDSLERARLHPDVLKNLNKNKKLKVAEAYSEDNPPPYPVTSVNGQTGDVTVQGGSGSGIAIQPDPPTDGELVWIDTDDPGTTHIIPEIDDTQESTVDTWSSQKIASEIAGANDSGASYCKMPDGTLICWGSYVSEARPTSAAGNLYTTGAFNPGITFPVRFTAKPAVAITPGPADAYSIVLVSIYSTAGITSVTLGRPNADYLWPAFSWIAIGRWK